MSCCFKHIMLLKNKLIVPCQDKPILSTFSQATLFQLVTAITAHKAAAKVCPTRLLFRRLLEQARPAQFYRDAVFIAAATFAVIVLMVKAVEWLSNCRNRGRDSAHSR